jgi:hypothetical protein
VNLCLQSDVFVFYKDYYNRLNKRVTKFPVPTEIYEFETIVKNIDRYIESDDEPFSLFKVMLNQTKHLIVYLSYFPFIRNELRKRFNPEKEIFELFSTFDDTKILSIKKILLKRDGLISTSMFYGTNYNPIFEIIKYIDRIKEIDYVDSIVLPNYKKLYDKLKNEKFEEQLYLYYEFIKKYKYYIEKAYNEIFNVDDFHNTVILNNFVSLWSESKYKERQVFEFTGDFMEDYRRYIVAYNKNK